MAVAKGQQDVEEGKNGEKWVKNKKKKRKKIVKDLRGAGSRAEGWLSSLCHHPWAQGPGSAHPASPPMETSGEKAKAAPEQLRGLWQSLAVWGEGENHPENGKKRIGDD